MKKVLILSLALILLLGVAANGTFGLFSDAETSTGNTFTAWVEEVYVKFHVCDHSNNRVYKYDSTGSLVTYFSLSPNGPTSPQGVATVGTDVYVLDSGGDYVYHYTSDGTFVDSSRRLMPVRPSGLVTNGLSIDGDDLWLVSSTTAPQQICRYSLSDAFTGSGDLSPLQTITLDSSNDEATGLAINDTYLYVVDIDDLQLYRYPRSGGPAVVSRVLREVDGSSLSEPRGATADDGFMWVVDCGTDKVYKYDKNDLFSGGGPLNASWEFDLASSNDWASGI